MQMNPKAKKYVHQQNPRMISYKIKSQLDGSAESGKSAEQRLKTILYYHLQNYQVANHYEDRILHIDCSVVVPIERPFLGFTGKVTIECKAMKRLSRQDREANAEFVFLEIRGVNRPDGSINEGWLYGGHAQIIAFEGQFGFFFFRREDLIQFAKEIEMRNEWVDRSWKAHEKLYSRSGPDGVSRGDIVTFVSIQKLRERCQHIFLKEVLCVEPKMVYPNISHFAT